jgi:hypothetical protein
MTAQREVNSAMGKNAKPKLIGKNEIDWVPYTYQEPACDVVSLHSQIGNILYDLIAHHWHFDIGKGACPYEYLLRNRLIVNLWVQNVTQADHALMKEYNVEVPTHIREEMRLCYSLYPINGVFGKTLAWMRFVRVVDEEPAYEEERDVDDVMTSTGYNAEVRDHELQTILEIMHGLDISYYEIVGLMDNF